MAKNYTFAEAVKIINAGADMESIADIGRRYPNLLHKVTKVTTKAGEDFVNLMSYMPDYLTANKVNSALKNAAGGSTETDDEDAGAEETAEVESNDAATKATDAFEWNESMSAKQLWDILGKAGKRKLAKSTKKADLVEACKQAFGATADADEAENEAEADEAETTEASTYEGKSAMELFKECKARKIKAVPKKPAKYYVELLVKDDAAKAEAAEAESDDEDWGDEEAEAPKKEDKKAAPKAAAKGGKAKAAKKAEAESEDDEDWDI